MIKSLLAWYLSALATTTGKVATVIAVTTIVASGAGAIVTVKHHNQSTQPITSTPEQSSPATASNGSPKIQTAKQPSNTSQSVQSDNSAVSDNASDTASTLDKYGCATHTPSYNQCVKNAKALWCNDQISKPALAFSNATIQARAAYNSVMNEWESVRYKAVHSPYSEYLDDATTKFKAIYEPAFTTYSKKVNSLNSQGCDFDYPSHESPGQYL